MIWTNQVSNIIHERTWHNTINDIGCNVGHLYKTLASCGPNVNELTHFEYYGIDIEPAYLKIARERFPKGKFVLSDVEQDPIPPAEISVCSATLEHLETPIQTLRSILGETKNLIILRTLVGESSQSHLRMKPKAKKPYVIHQFSFLELLTPIEEYGFHTEVIRDTATDSMPKYIDKGIVRTQYIVVGRKES